MSDLLRARIFIYLQTPKVCWVFFLVSPRDFILLGLAAWPETFPPSHPGGVDVDFDRCIFDVLAGVELAGGSSVRRKH